MPKKVLVVDDSIFIQEEMKQILQGSDFEVAGYAKTGEEALAIYETLRPDVVTMDIILPGMDGIDTARCILERWPGARVVMVSSLAYDETFDQACRIGAAGFIFKPFEPEQILSALQKAMEPRAADL